MYPLDTLKTRLQAPDYNDVYKNANGTTKRTLYRGLYQGIGSIILITIPSSGAFFTTYEALKFTLGEAVPPNSTLYLPQPLLHSIASGGAELVSCAILTPAEVLKQNAQVYRSEAGKRGSTSWAVFKQFRNNPTRLWRGYTALAARNLPFTALQFPVFEHLKTYFMERRKTKKGGQPVDGILERARITAMSAGLAGSGAAWITTPIDVVKTRIMLSANEESGKPKGQQTNLLTQGLAGSRKSGWSIAKEVLQKEGTKGLFRGAALRAGWTAIGSGLYLGVYEGGRFYLEARREDSQANEGDNLMQRDWNKVKVGVGASRSQETVKKSAWQDE